MMENMFRLDGKKAVVVGAQAALVRQSHRDWQNLAQQ